MKPTTTPKRRRIVDTILTDVLFNLLVFYMLMVSSKSEKLSASRAIAARVPGMEHEITGLQGEIKQGRIDLTKSRRRGQAQQAIIDDSQSQIADLTGSVGQLSSENRKLSSRLRSGAPVTVVVLIDVTGSMSDPIVELQSSITTLFELMPNISMDFRVGVLAFRKGVVAKFPITQILPTYEDGGVSQKSVLTFVGSLHAEKSATNHLPVFKEAFGMLAKAHPQVDDERKERLIFLGDMGPAELDGKTGYSSSEIETRDRIVRGVKNWAGQGNRAVEALYAESEYTAADPAAAESRQWFKALGSVSEKSAFYTDTSSLLRAVLHASLD